MIPIREPKGMKDLPGIPIQEIKDAKNLSRITIREPKGMKDLPGIPIQECQ